MSTEKTAVTEVNLDDFDEQVVARSNQTLILVDFWADWCAPCHGLTPHLMRFIDSLSGEVSLAKVEVDEGENMKLAGKYRLRGFPTVILFAKGREIDRFSGARSTQWIHQWFSEAKAKIN